MKKAFAKEDPIMVGRSAVIVNRGWIPAQYRDKRSRPDETNSRQLVRLTGTWRRGKNVHDYKVPNNPSNNEWNNLCLEDIGIFWDLANFDEAKYFYFQSVDLETKTTDSPVMPMSKDEVINDHYGWSWFEAKHKNMYRGFAALSGVSALTMLFAL